MANHVCSNCVEDVYLKAIIDRKGQPAKCDVCHVERETAITVADLGEILEPILRELIELGDEVKRFSPDAENGYLEQEGDDLDYFVQEALGQYFEFNDEIIEAVIDAEGCWPPDGDEPFFSTSNSYVSRRVVDQKHWSTWRHLEQEIRHKRRFFNFGVKGFFDELFSDIETLLTHVERTNVAGSLVQSLPPGSLFYRSRKCDSDDLRERMFKQPYKYVGPPPIENAHSGRMNPDGISLFYGAREWETCLAEIRPDLGGESGTITVETTERLRLLDFTQFKHAYKLLSYFQPDYKEQAARCAFLRQLGDLISRPVVPGHEAEYLITQAMTEYLANEYPNRFDGLLYASTQRKEGTNVVLFPRSTTKGSKHPVKYKDGSITFYWTNKIEYGHDERKYRLGAKGLEPDLDWWDDPD